MEDTFEATVVDAGGGEVRLLVDRGTVAYPQVGTHVVVLCNARRYAHPEPWATYGDGCGGCRHTRGSHSNTGSCDFCPCDTFADMGA